MKKGIKANRDEAPLFSFMGVSFNVAHLVACGVVGIILGLLLVWLVISL